MHRSVLGDPELVAWLNENVVLVVSHSDTGHEEGVADAEGGVAPGCPLYPGLGCAQHRAIEEEIRAAEAPLPRIEFSNNRPISFLVSPSGEVTPLDAPTQMTPARLRERAEAIQKAAGRHVPWKKYAALLEELAATEAAAAAGRFKDGLKTLQKVEKEAARLPEALQAQVAAAVVSFEAAVRAEFERLKAAPEDPAVRLKAVGALRQQVALRLAQGLLPVVAELDAWIKEEKAR